MDTGEAMCESCNAKPGVLRCSDCATRRVRCADCMKTIHANLPLHRLEVRI